MPIQFQCPSCRSTLRVPDDLAGRRAKCPQCGGIAEVGPLISGSAFAVNESQPVRFNSQEAISPQPIPQTESSESEADAEENVDRPRQVKRRKRKKRKSQSSFDSVRSIVGPIIYLLFGFAIVAVLPLPMARRGHVDEMIIMYAIQSALLMPGSLVAFVLSMFVGRAIAGDADFGDFRIAIPKAMILLAPLNILFVPAGFNLCFMVFASLLSLAYWTFGFILLFRLDIWERQTWIMIVINWFLNIAANFFSILILAFVLVVVFHVRVG